MTKHRNFDAIVAWGEGKTLQVKSNIGMPYCGVPSDYWYEYLPNHSTTAFPAFNEPNFDWRVKPEVIKYKRFIWYPNLGINNENPRIMLVTFEEQEKDKRQCWEGFRRWVDLEWQEVEICSLK